MCFMSGYKHHTHTHTRTSATSIFTSCFITTGNQYNTYRVCVCPCNYSENSHEACNMANQYSIAHKSSTSNEQVVPKWGRTREKRTTTNPPISLNGNCNSNCCLAVHIPVNLAVWIDFIWIPHLHNIIIAIGTWFGTIAYDKPSVAQTHAYTQTQTRTVKKHKFQWLECPQWPEYPEWDWFYWCFCYFRICYC